MPQKYHIEALYLIFHFLSKNPKKILVMETSVPSVDESIFNLNTDWEDLYGDVVEEEPHLIPETLGRTVYVEYFVDTYHSGNFITRHPHSGILLFINNDLMKSFIKRKNTVESITFGSELVALRISRNMIVEIRIKLKLFGVNFGDTENVLCYNNGVVNSTSIPESTLSKKHNAINYHCVYEASAYGILRVRK